MKKIILPGLVALLIAPESAHAFGRRGGFAFSAGFNGGGFAFASGRGFGFNRGFGFGGGFNGFGFNRGFAFGTGFGFNRGFGFTPGFYGSNFGFRRGFYGASFGGFGFAPAVGYSTGYSLGLGGCPPAFALPPVTYAAGCQGYAQYAPQIQPQAAPCPQNFMPAADPVYAAPAPCGVTALALHTAGYSYSHAVGRFVVLRRSVFVHGGVAFARASRASAAAAVAVNVRRGFLGRTRSVSVAAAGGNGAAAVVNVQRRGLFGRRTSITAAAAGQGAAAVVQRGGRRR